MTKQEIIEQERVNTSHIILHLEGTFWIAYERSAHRFAKSVKPYSARKKYIKAAQQEIVSLGFPAVALDTLGVEILERTEKQATLRAPQTFTEQEFDEWKKNVKQEERHKPYNELNVYKESYDLLLTLFHMGKDMRREYKFTLGEELKKEMVSLVTDIFRACINHDKTPHIASARERIEATKMRVRLLHDLKQIRDLDKMAKAVLHMESISKQLTAWHNAEKQKQGKAGVMDGMAPMSEPDNFSSQPVPERAGYRWA
jgi:hypothetical protein